MPPGSAVTAVIGSKDRLNPVAQPLQRLKGGLAARSRGAEAGRSLDTRTAGWIEKGHRPAEQDSQRASRDHHVAVARLGGQASELLQAREPRPPVVFGGGLGAVPDLFETPRHLGSASRGVDGRPAAGGDTRAGFESHRPAIRPPLRGDRRWRDRRSARLHADPLTAWPPGPTFRAVQRSSERDASARPASRAGRSSSPTSQVVSTAESQRAPSPRRTAPRVPRRPRRPPPSRFPHAEDATPRAVVGCVLIAPSRAIRLKSGPARTFINSARAEAASGLDRSPRPRAASAAASNFNASSRARRCARCEGHEEG